MLTLLSGREKQSTTEALQYVGEQFARRADVPAMVFDSLNKPAKAIHQMRLEMAFGALSSNREDFDARKVKWSSYVSVSGQPMVYCVARLDYRNAKAKVA